MKLQLVRHATLLLEYAGMKILVDPMLSDAGTMAAIQNSPQPRPNPLVPLPFPVELVLDGVQLVLVTQYFDTIKSIGELDKTNTLFLSHSPGAVNDIGQQIMQAMIAAEKAGKG